MKPNTIDAISRTVGKYVDVLTEIIRVSTPCNATVMLS